MILGPNLLMKMLPRKIQKRYPASNKSDPVRQRGVVSWRIQGDGGEGKPGVLTKYHDDIVESSVRELEVFL